MESYLSQSYINNTEDFGFYNLNSLSEIFYTSLYGRFPYAAEQYDSWHIRFTVYISCGYRHVFVITLTLHGVFTTISGLP